MLSRLWKVVSWTPAPFYGEQDHVATVYAVTYPPVFIVVANTEVANGSQHNDLHLTMRSLKNSLFK